PIAQEPRLHLRDRVHAGTLPGLCIHCALSHGSRRELLSDAAPWLPASRLSAELAPRCAILQNYPEIAFRRVVVPSRSLVRIQIDFEMSCELYQRLLGNDWWVLAEPVRRAHSVGEEKRGCFRVSHGEGWLARQLARWSQLPQPANAAETQLKITSEGAGQLWERRFDGHAFTTRQWAEDGRH